MTFLCPQSPPPFSVLATAGRCCHPWLMLTAANRSDSCNRVTLPKGRNTHCHDLGAWKGWEWTCPGAQDRKNADASSPCETFSCPTTGLKIPRPQFSTAKVMGSFAVLRPSEADSALSAATSWALPSGGRGEKSGWAKATSSTIPGSSTWLGWGFPGWRSQLS